MIDCLFCRIVVGETPADVVYQDENVVAFRDINPQAPVHVLVIPREHIPSLGEAVHEHAGVLGQVAYAAARVAEQEGVGESGYRCVVNTGEDGGQTVRHLHMHVLGGKPMGWPPY